MLELDFVATNVDGAREEILSLVQRNSDNKIIYFHGWDGFGTAAVLKSIHQLVSSTKYPPSERCFDRTIYIDCSKWKSKRVMQRKIADELKLDHKIMAMFDKQDEEDDFNGVDHGSRDVIRNVAGMIDQVLRDSKFMVIFLNGSDEEIVLSTFGIPEYGDCIIIWTFKRRFMAMSPRYGKIADKLRYTDLFLFGQYGYFGLSSPQLSALFWEEATNIVACHPCIRDINLTMVIDCCLYGLFLYYSLHNTTRFGWAAHAPNYWIYDGIIQGDRAREISNALHPEISFECDDSLLDTVCSKITPDSGTPFLVRRSDDEFFYLYVERPYRWISIKSKNSKSGVISKKEMHEHMLKIVPCASSIFLSSGRTESPLILQNALFEQCKNLGVLVLSYCAFSFVSPPFLCCQMLKFLGLDHCTDSNDTKLEGQGCTAEWACLHSLSVLDNRSTDWDEILSEEKIGLMANLAELNIEGVRCWQYTSQLQKRLPNLERLRITKPVCQAEFSKDISNSFMDKTKLELLDLSGNSEMRNLPTSLSMASNLQVLIPDDERELFVVAWCAHPDLVPDEMMIAIPEPEPEHDGGPLLSLRPWEIIHHEVPALRYLVRLRLVEFQDWHTPPPSSDDDYGGRRDSDSDGGDSNYNGYWPGFTSSGGGGRRPRATSYRIDGDPRLGPGSGPACLPRQQCPRIRVGDFLCPVTSPNDAILCSPAGSRIPAAGAARGGPLLALEVDPLTEAHRSHSPVTSMEADPMCAEASFCATPKAVAPAVDASVHSIDRDPRRAHASASLRRGLRKLVDDDHSLQMGRNWPVRSEDGPAFLFEPGLGLDQGPEMLLHDMELFVDLDADCVARPTPGRAAVLLEVHQEPLMVNDESVPAVDTLDDGAAHHVDDPANDAPDSDVCSAAATVSAFINMYKKPLEQPVLLSTPKLRRTKSVHTFEDDEWIPKRSARLAAKSKFREDKPEAQARKVMMKKMGYEVETAVPDEASFEEFQEFFRQPLSPSKREALDILFPGRKQRALGAVRAA